jgi:hypothetical protein
MLVRTHHPHRNNGPLRLALLAERATTVAPWNTVVHYRNSGEPLPTGVATDLYGEQTTDPHKARFLVPAGAYKGFGLVRGVRLLWCGVRLLWCGVCLLWCGVRVVSSLVWVSSFVLYISVCVFPGRRFILVGANW